MKSIATFFGTNIKFLRSRAQYNQTEMAELFDMTRAKLNSYENGVAINPPLADLMLIADYHKVSIDTIVKVDLCSLSETRFQQLMESNEAFVTGTKIRVLASTVDSDNKENIEVVPIKARAGYTAGYNDPLFISKLKTFQLPFLSQERKYRTFQIEGDSMLPIPDKSYVITEYIQNWYDIKDNTACIVVTQDDGIVFKVLFNELKKYKSFRLHSLNELFEDYMVEAHQIKEIWRFVNYFSNEIPEPISDKGHLMRELKEMEDRIHHMKQKLV